MNQIIAEALFNGKLLVVEKLASGMYQVKLDGVIKHPNCTCEDALRAVFFYLNSLS